MTPEFRNQMLEAAGWTFLETFLITIAPSVAVMPAGDWHGLLGLAASAAMSAGAACVSVLKSYLIRNVGGKDSTLISAPSVEACEATLDEVTVG